MKDTAVKSFAKVVGTNEHGRYQMQTHFDTAEAVAYEQFSSALSARVNEIRAQQQAHHGLKEEMQVEFLWVRTLDKLSSQMNPQEFKTLLGALTTVSPYETVEGAEAEAEQEEDIKALATRRTDREKYRCGEEGTLRTAAVGKTIRAFLESKHELIVMRGLHTSAPKDDIAPFTSSTLNRRQIILGAGASIAGGAVAGIGASKRPSTMDRLGRPLSERERSLDRIQTAAGHGIAGALIGGFAGQVYLSESVKKAYGAWEEKAGIPSHKGLEAVMQQVATLAEAYEQKQAVTNIR